jgi:hypothetical protein
LHLQIKPMTRSDFVDCLIGYIGRSRALKDAIGTPKNDNEGSRIQAVKPSL